LLLDAEAGISPKLFPMKRANLPDGTPVWCDAPLAVRAVWDEIQTYFPEGQSVKAGDVVFDVGANIGLFSLAAWQQSGGMAQIYGFEPMPATCAIYEANARAFDPEGNRWTTIRAGLGERDEMGVFHHFPRISVLSGRVRDRNRAFADMDKALAAPTLGAPLEIFNIFPAWSRRLSGAMVGQFLLATRPVAASVWTLSRALRTLGVERVDWLKIDVEGAELDVLRGVSEADWPRIQRVLLEAESGEQEGEMRGLLESAGFRVHSRANPVFAGHDLRTLFAVRER